METHLFDLLISSTEVVGSALLCELWRYSLRQKTIGIFFVLTAAVLFGINGSLSRLLFSSGVTPLTLVEFRMIVGGLCLFGFLCAGPRYALKLPLRSLGWVIAFGISMAVVTYTYFVSISRIPIAVTLVIQMTRYQQPQSVLLATRIQ